MAPLSTDARAPQVIERSRLQQGNRMSTTLELYAAREETIGQDSQKVVYVDHRYLAHGPSAVTFQPPRHLAEGNMNGILVSPIATASETPSYQENVGVLVWNKSERPFHITNRTVLLEMVIVTRRGECPLQLVERIQCHWNRGRYGTVWTSFDVQGSYHIPLW